MIPKVPLDSEASPSVPLRPLASLTCVLFLLDQEGEKVSFSGTLRLLGEKKQTPMFMEVSEIKRIVFFVLKGAQEKPADGEASPDRRKGLAKGWFWVWEGVDWMDFSWFF